MTEPAHFDGNAVGGLLREVFGAEMTDKRGCCDQCGAVNVMAAVVVYRRAPGDVLRCPNCGTVIMVVVEIPTGTRIGFGSLRWIDLG